MAKRPAPRHPPAEAAEETELSLSFDESWDVPQQELPLPDSQEEFSLGTPEDAALRIDGGEESAGAPPKRKVSRAENADVLLPDDEDNEEAALPFAPGAALEEDEEEEEDDEDEEDEDGSDDDGEDEDELDEESDGEDGGVSRHRASLISLFVFVSVIVGLYFILARTLVSNRQLADNFVGKLPLVGSSITADRLLFRKVTLANVTGAYVTIKNGKRVFVISGTASNTASQALRGIQIEGRLLDDKGLELQRETIICGGMLTQQMLRDLSQRELEILRRVEPPKGFTVAPGQSTSFTIVFPDPPKNVAEFASRVTTAQRAA